MVGLAGGWLTYELLSARGDLRTARHDLSTFQHDAVNGDSSAAEGDLAKAQDRVHRADTTLHRPQWSALAHLPLLGRNVVALRTISASVDRVVSDDLPPLLEVSRKVSIKTIKRGNGQFDFEPLRTAQAPIDRVQVAVSREAATIAAVDTGDLLGPIAGPIRTAQKTAAKADAALKSLAVAAGIVPDLLQGHHSYLTVFQNNSEIRPTGGLAGAWSVLKVDNGRISVGKQGAGAKVQSPTEVEPYDAAARRAWGNTYTQDFRDPNLNPDYPTAARIQSELLASVEGVHTDGVVALDPVTLAYMLAGTGPVKINDGVTLDSHNAVDFLLNGVYIKYRDPAVEDAFFALATRKIFDRLSTGSFNTSKLVSGLARAGKEDRIKLWVPAHRLEKKIEPTAVGGALPVGTDPPAVGIYLSDGTMAKMDYYLNAGHQVVATSCSAAGVQTYGVSLFFASTAPKNAASTLPSYVLGPTNPVPGRTVVNIFAIAPRGGGTPTFTVLGKAFRAKKLSIGGRPASELAIPLPAGGALPVRVTMTSAPGQRGPTAFAMTPTVRSGVNRETIPSACQ
ncbi:MAG: hypothetical protein JWP74_2636 [Marmoricola sp.]|nr:hypothetical protein [Marmoricola sp.]